MTIVHLTEKEVAARLRVTTRALRKWRADGNGGPRCMGIGSDGKTIRYREQDVIDYELGRIIQKDIPVDAKRTITRAAEVMEVILRWNMGDDARNLIGAVRNDLRALIVTKKGA